MVTKAPTELDLNSPHLSTGMKERALKNTAIVLVFQGIKLVLQLVSIAILARLLQPSDFGLMAMVTVFTGLALQLMEGGLSIATIQRDKITHAQVSNLFWVNVALGMCMCALCIIISPLVAIIYDEPRLKLVMVVMSLTYVIAGLSVQHDALLRRQMRFKAVSTIEIVSIGMGVIVAVTVGLMGFGYWALVFSVITTVAIKSIMCWLILRWLPSMISYRSGVRPLLSFGANLTGANFIGYLATNITPLAVGYIGGAQTLGLFNRANMLTSIPSSQVLPPVLRVLEPFLARLSGEQQRLHTAIKSLLAKLVLGTMFVTLAMIVQADLIIVLFLGPGWEDALPIFWMLAIFSLVEPIAGFLAVCLVATGNAKALLRWKAITLVVLIVSVSIGSSWGAIGVVAAYSLSGVFVRLPGFMYYASLFLPITFGELIKALIPSAIAALGTIAALVALRQSNIIDHPTVGLVVFTFAAAAIYLALCLLIKASRYELINILTLLKSLTQRKSDQNDR